MKNFLLFTATCLLSLSAGAQPIKVNTFEEVKRSTVPFLMQENAGSRRALAANQYLCGYYNTDDLAQYGLGVTSLNEVCKVANEFDPDIYGAFAGFTVVGMRVGLCADISDFGVFISKIENDNFVDFKEKSVGAGKKGWNTVMFDEADQFTLPTEGSFLVGFSYKQKKGSTNDCYPLSCYEESSKVGELLFYGTLNNGQRWYNFGASYGTLSVQLIVEGELSEQKAIINGLQTATFGKVGNELSGVISITNMGKDAINSLGFNYYIDDVVVGNTTISQAIASVKTENVNLNIALPSDLSVGKHMLKVELTKINDAAPIAEVTNNNVTVEFSAYEESKPRQKQLVEHITSWTCTYCYLGYNLLRQMEQQYDDVAWVAIHGNQSSQTDPYYFSECEDIMSYLGVTSFPSASFNRTYLPDLADGETSIVYGIGYYEQYISQLVPMIHDMMVENNSPSFVSLDITSSFDADSRQMEVTVKGTGVSQAAQLLDGYGLNIYVTEAGLTGRQYSGGSWSNNFEHNNTLRAVLTNVNGDDITWNGDNFSMTKTYTVPATYNENNLSIVAFVAPHPGNIYNMEVNNCEKTNLTLTPSAIQTINKDTNATEKARYTLDGHEISAPQHGINIVKMSDGTVRKITVK
mgnify:CR=1 FL=1